MPSSSTRGTRALAYGLQRLDQMCTIPAYENLRCPSADDCRNIAGACSSSTGPLFRRVTEPTPAQGPLAR
jgi:hypothetical protein